MRRPLILLFTCYFHRQAKLQNPLTRKKNLPHHFIFFSFRNLLINKYSSLRVFVRSNISRGESFDDEVGYVTRKHLPHAFIHFRKVIRSYSVPRTFHSACLIRPADKEVG